MTSDKVIYCSFCGKSHHEVSRIVAGPSAWICTECALTCASICLEPPHKSPAEAKIDQFLDQIAKAHTALDGLIGKCNETSSTIGSTNQRSEKVIGYEDLIIMRDTYENHGGPFKSLRMSAALKAIGLAVDPSL